MIRCYYYSYLHIWIFLSPRMCRMCSVTPSQEALAPGIFPTILPHPNSLPGYPTACGHWHQAIQDHWTRSYLLVAPHTYVNSLRAGITFPTSLVTVWQHLVGPQALATVTNAWRGLLLCFAGQFLSPFNPPHLLPLLGPFCSPPQCEGSFSASFPSHSHLSHHSSKLLHTLAS